MEKEILIWSDGYSIATNLPEEVAQFFERFGWEEAILVLDGAPLNNRGCIDLSDPEQYRVFAVSDDGHLTQLTGSKKPFHFIRAFVTPRAREIFRETWSVPMFVL
jgi:hypothetical protein